MSITLVAQLTSIADNGKATFLQTPENYYKLTKFSQLYDCKMPYTVSSVYVCNVPLSAREYIGKLCKVSITIRYCAFSKSGKEIQTIRFLMKDLEKV